MTESSMFFDGISLGDATIAPYSATEFATFFTNLMSRPSGGVQNQGYISRAVYGDGALLVSGGVSPVAVAAGAAMVLGRMYLNDATVGVVIPTPSVNPRVDRVVLRLDFAAQTIRVVRVTGTEAANPTPPALTQINGTTWEISLAQVYITTGGFTQVRDERVGGIGMGGAVLFRDIARREFEEFFDNFHNDSIVSGAIGNTQWQSTLVNTGLVSVFNAAPSAIALTSGATAASSATIHHGNFNIQGSQAPLLFEWFAQALNAAADAATLAFGSLTNSGITQQIRFGVDGSVSTTNLIISATNGGTTSFVTPIAIDTTTTLHKFGLYLPSAASGWVALYDGVPVGYVGATLPASGTNLRAQLAVANGVTATVRSIPILDWARLVRGS